MEFCIEVWAGTIDGNSGGTKVGIGFDDCPFEEGFCTPQP